MLESQNAETGKLAGAAGCDKSAESRASTVGCLTNASWAGGKRAVDLAGRTLERIHYSVGYVDAVPRQKDKWRKWHLDTSAANSWIAAVDS